MAAEAKRSVATRAVTLAIDRTRQDAWLPIERRRIADTVDCLCQNLSWSLPPFATSASFFVGVAFLVVWQCGQANDESITLFGRRQDFLSHLSKDSVVFSSSVCAAVGITVSILMVIGPSSATIYSRQCFAARRAIDC